MRIFPVIVKKTFTTVQEGDAPPGGFTDAFRLGIRFPDSNLAPSDAMSIALAFPDTLAGQIDSLLVGLVAADVTPEQIDAFRLAIAGLGDTNPAPSDVASYAFALALADAVAGQSDAALLTLLGLGDVNAEQVDALLLTLQGLGDTNVTPGEAMLLAIAGFTDLVAAQSELLKLGFPAPDFADTSPAPTEARTFDVTSWGTSTTTAGTAPTNAANATGVNNGTVATCKAAGLPTVVASTLNVIIARGGVPAGGTKTIRVWYSTNAGVADTFTLTYTATGGTPVTIDLPDGNFLTTPFEQAITNIGGAVDPVFTFTHNCTVAATGGSISVDAAAIKTSGAF